MRFAYLCPKCRIASLQACVGHKSQRSSPMKTNRLRARKKMDLGLALDYWRLQCLETFLLRDLSVKHRLH